jgi:uncharacterized membrane protein YqjE
MSTRDELHDRPVGELLKELSSQTTALVRQELELAKAEMAEKGKRAGIGIGLFSGAGLLAFFGVAALVTTAILALSLAVAAWLSALIVAAVLFTGAAALGLGGRSQVQEATPPAPERAVEGVKEDIATVKGHHP